MTSRFTSILTAVLAVSMSIPVFGQSTESPTGDRFADSLRELQQRMEALETQNARLESQLIARPELDSGDKPDVFESSDAADTVPDSLESLLKSAEETGDRLSKIEEKIKKDAEAEKKKDEGAKKSKNW